MHSPGKRVTLKHSLALLFFSPIVIISHAIYPFPRMNQINNRTFGILRNINTRASARTRTVCYTCMYCTVNLYWMTQTRCKTGLEHVSISNLLGFGGTMLQHRTIMMVVEMAENMRISKSSKTNHNFVICITLTGFRGVY